MVDETLKVLKSEEELCHNIPKEIVDEEHWHICDFKLQHMLSKFYKNYKSLEKDYIKDCKNYLKSIDRERDEREICCDFCPHMKYISKSKDGFILNVATLGVDDILNDSEYKKALEYFTKK